MDRRQEAVPPGAARPDHFALLRLYLLPADSRLRPLTLAGTTQANYLESKGAYSFLESNFRYLYDCFPSLHTANPWLIVWLSRGKVPGWLMASAVSAGCGITLSTIALQVHYGIDDLAGLAWVFLIAAVAKATLPGERLA
jgi:membrane-associated phospholipid phosphatase